MKTWHGTMKWMLMLMATMMVAVAQDMSFEGLLKEGAKAYKDGEYGTAAERFEDAGKLRPDDARVVFNEALSRYMNTEYDKARDGFQRALEKGFAEDDTFKARCELGIGNCHYRESVQKKDEAKDKPLQEQLEAVKEAKASCDQSIESYGDAIRHSRKLKNAKDNLKTARKHRKELVKNLRLLEEELKKQPQQQQQSGDQKQDGEQKQEGEQQQQDAQQKEGQQQEGEQKEGEQQQGEQQQKSAEQQLDELAKQQSQAAEKNEQGQQSQQQAADEQKDISNKTEAARKVMEQQREEAEKQDGQSTEKSEAEKKLEEAQEAQKKAEDALEKGDMKSASEAQKEAAEKLDEAKKAMSEGDKKEEEEKQQEEQKQEGEQPKDDASEEQMSEAENDVKDILDQERNNRRRRLKLMRVKPVEKDW